MTISYRSGRFTAPPELGQAPEPGQVRELAALRALALRALALRALAPQVLQTDRPQALALG